MLKTGWEVNNFIVIVIDPELEAWILQDTPVVEQAFRSTLQRINHKY